MPAWLFCMVWCHDFEFRGTQALVDTQSVLTIVQKDDLA